MNAAPATSTGIEDLHPLFDLLYNIRYSAQYTVYSTLREDISRQRRTPEDKAIDCGTKGRSVTLCGDFLSDLRAKVRYSGRGAVFALLRVICFV